MSDNPSRFVIVPWPEGTRADTAPVCRCGGAYVLNAERECRSCWAIRTIVRELLVEMLAQPFIPASAPLTVPFGTPLVDIKAQLKQPREKKP